MIFLHCFTFPTPSASRSHPPFTTLFSPDSGLAWEDDEVDRNTRETPLTRIYHTDIAGSRFRIAYRDAREGGREYRATQVIFSDEVIFF